MLFTHREPEHVGGTVQTLGDAEKLLPRDAGGWAQPGSTTLANGRWLRLSLHPGCGGACRRRAVPLTPRLISPAWSQSRARLSTGTLPTWPAPAPVGSWGWQERGWGPSTVLCADTAPSSPSAEPAQPSRIRPSLPLPASPLAAGFPPAHLGDAWCSQLGPARHNMVSGARSLPWGPCPTQHPPMPSAECSSRIPGHGGPAAPTFLIFRGTWARWLTGYAPCSD